MKKYVLILLVFFISCKEDEVTKDPEPKEKGVCVYKRNTCTNANPQYCLPPLQFIGCIPKWDAYKYGNANLYKIESCECEL